MSRIVTSVTMPRYAVLCILSALRKDAENLEKFEPQLPKITKRKVDEFARERENARMIARDDRAVYGILAAFDNGDVESITITPNQAKGGEE